MHRLPILIVITICCLCGLIAPAFALDYCAPVGFVLAGGKCACLVWNYATTRDTNITIELSWWDAGLGSETWGPDYIPPNSGSVVSHEFTSGGYCGCKVTGDGGLSRTSLSVRSSDNTLLTVVPCGIH